MTKKKPSRKPFAQMTVDDIFGAWEASARAGLKQGMRFAPEIFAPRSHIVKDYKLAISRRMGDTVHPFNAADYRNSNRVAKDIGRICGIVSADDKSHVVSLDVFEMVAELAKAHASCPVPPVGGGGIWCDVA
jgi:hypothetical protein